MTDEEYGVSQSPLTLWNLTKLYDSDTLVSENDLLKELCEASFDMLTKDGDNPQKFRDSLEFLLKHKLIIERTPHHNNHNNTFNLMYVRYFQITQTGILFYRKNVINIIIDSQNKAFSDIKEDGTFYFLKDKDNVDNFDISDNIRKKILDGSGNLSKIIVKLILDNSPQMINVLRWCLGHLSG